MTFSVWPGMICSPAERVDSCPMTTPNADAIRVFRRVLKGCETLEKAMGAIKLHKDNSVAWQVLDQALRGEVVKDQIPDFALIRDIILNWAQARLSKETVDSIKACLNFSP